MATVVRSVATALAMLRGVHLALGVRSETGESAGGAAAQGAATAACPQSPAELDALMGKLTPIYDLERKRMTASINADELAPKYAARAEKWEGEAAELDKWFKQHPIADKWKTWKKPICTPSGGLDFMGIPGDDCDDPLTREQEFALLWQKKARARKQHAAGHKGFKLKWEEFKQNATIAYDKGRTAMDTVGSQLIGIANSDCDKLAKPFTDAAAKIPKLPEGVSEVEKVEEARKQLDALWAKVADLKDCLPAKWKAGADGGPCFEAMSK